MPAEVRTDRADNRAFCGGEGAVRDRLAGEPGKFRPGLRADADVLCRQPGGGGRGNKAGAGARSGGNGVGYLLVLDDRLANDPCFAAGIGGLVGLVIGCDLGFARGCSRHGVGTDLRNPQNALLGDDVTAAVLSIESLEIAVRRIEAGAEQFGGHDSDLTLTLFQQHRGIGPRHAEGDPRIHNRRRQDQALGQPRLEHPADVGVRHLLLREELGVGLFAELAVESTCLRQIGDLGIDQALRQDEPMVGCEGDQRMILDQRFQQRVELVGDARIGRFGILLPCLVEEPPHGRIKIAGRNPFVANANEGVPARTEPAGPDAAHVGKGERSKDCNQEQDHDGGPDRGF